jgi:hypothetical protein
LPISQDGPEFVVTLIMAVVVGIATAACREPLRWRVVLGLAGVGLAIACLAFIVYFLSSSPEPLDLFVLAFLAMGSVPFAALLCALQDLAEREHYDFFHWVGVATLLGVAAHVVALIGAGRPMG